LESEQKNSKKMLAAKTKLEQELQTANNNNKVSEQALQITLLEAKSKRLEEELNEATSKLDTSSDLKTKFEKEKKSLANAIGRFARSVRR